MSTSYDGFVSSIADLLKGVFKMTILFIIYFLEQKRFAPQYKMKVGIVLQGNVSFVRTICFAYLV